RRRRCCGGRYNHLGCSPSRCDRLCQSRESSVLSTVGAEVIAAPESANRPLSPEPLIPPSRPAPKALETSTVDQVLAVESMAELADVPRSVVASTAPAADPPPPAAASAQAVPPAPATASTPPPSPPPSSSPASAAPPRPAPSSPVAPTAESTPADSPVSRPVPSCPPAEPAT